MYKIHAFEKDFKIIFKSGYGNFTAATIDTASNLITVYSIVPPSEFIQVVAHEIQHGINSDRYCQFWGIILGSDHVDMAIMMKLLDEQAAMASEDAITLYLNHKNELNTILKEYKKFHNNNKVRVIDEDINLVIEESKKLTDTNRFNYPIKQHWLNH